MCTKAMRRSLHKLASWLRRFYSSNGHHHQHHHKAYSEGSDSAISDSRGKKLDSRNSSDTESESLHRGTINSRQMAQHLPGSHIPLTTRTSIPDSEEYKKMISGVPYRVLDDIQLKTEKVRARRFCAKYNVDDEVLKDDEMPLHELFIALRTERERMLRTIIGRIGQGPVIEPPFHFQYGCNITMGDSVYANVNLRIMDSGEVTIGDRVLIGPNVTIVTELHDKELASRREVHAHPVTIEEDCWIGVGTTILPGVTIGKGSVIGAGSIVTRSIPPFSVAWGDPARVVEPVKDAVYDQPN